MGSNEVFHSDCQKFELISKPIKSFIKRAMNPLKLILLEQSFYLRLFRTEVFVLRYRTGFGRQLVLVFFKFLKSSRATVGWQVAIDYFRD